MKKSIERHTKILDRIVNILENNSKRIEALEKHLSKNKTKKVVKK